MGCNPWSCQALNQCTTIPVHLNENGIGSWPDLGAKNAVWEWDYSECMGAIIALLWLFCSLVSAFVRCSQTLLYCIISVPDLVLCYFTIQEIWAPQCWSFCHLQSSLLWWLMEGYVMKREKNPPLVSTVGSLLSLNLKSSVRQTSQIVIFIVVLLWEGNRIVSRTHPNTLWSHV